MNGFNIKKQAAAAQVEDQGTFVHIHGLDDLPMFYKDAEGNEQPVGITVAGSHSARCREVDGQMRKRRIKVRNLTGQSILEDTIERVARCTLSWQGFFVDDGSTEELVRCDVANARVLYKECPWVLDQVSEAMNDHSRFFSKESSR